MKKTRQLYCCQQSVYVHPASSPGRTIRYYASAACARTTLLVCNSDSNFAPSPINHTTVRYSWLPWLKSSRFVVNLPLWGSRQERQFPRSFRRENWGVLRWRSFTPNFLRLLTWGGSSTPHPKTDFSKSQVSSWWVVPWPKYVYKNVIFSNKIGIPMILG